MTAKKNKKNKKNAKQENNNTNTQGTTDKQNANSRQPFSVQISS